MNLSTGSVDVVEKYDPVLDTWTKCKSMNNCRGGHALISYFGRLIAIGGMNNFMSTCQDSEWYNEVTDEWTLMSQTNMPRFGCVAVTLPFCRRPRSFVEQIENIEEDGEVG